MNYWWVNQNQTYRYEVDGGYLWSPKRNADGRRNPFYEFMRIVVPGDMVFSFQATYIRAIGIVQSFAYSHPKPAEFGNVGANWGPTGWCVDVRYHQLDSVVRPKDSMVQLLPLLPGWYSPLQANGNGNQSVYLTRVPTQMAAKLIELIGEEAARLHRAVNQVNEPPGNDYRVGADLADWEGVLEQRVREDRAIEETERSALILARRGQGLFRQRVRAIEMRCRITQVDRMEYLRASHIKPWSQCEEYAERLDGHNGLMLTPNADHLFDRGFISFEDDGEVLVSPVANELSLERMGINVFDRGSTGRFTDQQREYMNYHREQVFLKADIAKLS